jgi:hypothetical protein
MRRPAVCIVCPVLVLQAEKGCVEGTRLVLGLVVPRYPLQVSSQLSDALTLQKQKSFSNSLTKQVSPGKRAVRLMESVKQSHRVTLGWSDNQTCDNDCTRSYNSLCINPARSLRKPPSRFATKHKDCIGRVESGAVGHNFISTPRCLLLLPTRTSPVGFSLACASASCRK